MGDNSSKCILCAVLTGLMLVVILVPLSLSYLEYYEYGLDQRKTTGSVDTKKVYARGRYLLGIDHHFIKYQADAHYEVLEELSVFSAGGSNESIGLEFQLDIDFTYFLIEAEIGSLHKELASNYRNIILSRARDAIKNEAIRVTFTQYFQARRNVEDRFRKAVQKRWEQNPSLHCSLDQFHLGRIRIPESVATKQLQSSVQNEKNDKESFLQQAQLEREQTAVEVNGINLQQQKVIRTANAEANLIRAKAVAEAERIKALASINGTSRLYASVGIATQEQKTAYSYIRTLRDRSSGNSSLAMEVSYLSSENVVRTAPVA